MGNNLLKYRAPRVSFSSMVHSFCNNIGPVSRPSSGQNIVIPVFFDPIDIGQFIDEGPRCMGNNDG